MRTSVLVVRTARNNRPNRLGKTQRVSRVAALGIHLFSIYCEHSALSRRGFVDRIVCVSPPGCTTVFQTVLNSKDLSKVDRLGNPLVPNREGGKATNEWQMCFHRPCRVLARVQFASNPPLRQRKNDHKRRPHPKPVRLRARAQAIPDDASAVGGDPHRAGELDPVVSRVDAGCV